MAQTIFSGKERIGRITLERYRDSLRLRWTLKGKTYSLTIGKDSRDTLKAARAKADRINSDIVFDRFDFSLKDYDQNLTVLEDVSEIQPVQEIKLQELWEKFFEDKLPNIKHKTVEKYENFTKLFDKLGDGLIYDGLAVKKLLLDTTTADRTRDCLMYLNACCDWGIKRKLIQYNPFVGMASEMPKPRYLTEPNPNAFSEIERDRTIEAFKNDKRPGMNYQHYASFVEFLFLTGCRPSEAVGLTWDKVSDDCSQILFDCSIQTLSSGKRIKVEGSKNNQKRTITTSSKAQKLLLSIKPESIAPDSLIFHSPDSESLPISYQNFSRRAWRSVVDPIKTNTTPYNCRDTFITLQLLNGVPSAVVAKWCDTSTQMIDRSYADKLKLSQIKPVD